jgi:glycerol uptake facilitator-like aquaporin
MGVALAFGLTLLTMCHGAHSPGGCSLAAAACGIVMTAFQGGRAISQLRLFWIAPIVGGVMGALTCRSLFAADQD